MEKKRERLVLLDGVFSAIDEQLAKISRYAAHISPGQQLLLGSGKEGAFITAAPCASITCASDSTLALECPRCRLVSYCSPACKAAHAHIHKRVCGIHHPRAAHHQRTAHIKAEAEKRINEHHFSHHWGNVPAISLINPARTTPATDLNLCFAASGDLRDLFSTLSKLPESFTGRVHILINDANFGVSARNFLMLELLRLHGKEAIECVIALWYSLGMTQAQSLACKAAAFNALERSGFCNLLASGSRDPLPPLEAAAFARGCSTLTVDFPASCWGKLLASLCGSPRASEVAEMRSSATIWKDLGSLFHWESGLLLPFSCIGQMQFSAGNSFLLRRSPGSTPGSRGTFTWPISCHADVLSGWDFDEVMLTARECGCPAEDYYGALFFHCKRVVAGAVEALERCKVDIKLTCLDAHEQAERVRSSGSMKFDAISTSNISDDNFLGLKTVVSDWGPLLKSSGILITLSMMWCWCPDDPMKVVKELEWRGARERPSSPAQLVCNSSLEAAFRRRMREIGAHAAAESGGVEARKRHLLVPRRLYVPVDAPVHACPAEYRREEVLERGCKSWSFMERYMEWQPVKT